MEPCVVGREFAAKGAGESRRGAAGPSCWLSPSGEGEGFRFVTKGEVAPYRLGFGAGDCLGSAEGRGVLTRVAARVTALTRFLPAL